VRLTKRVESQLMIIEVTPRHVFTWGLDR